MRINPAVRWIKPKSPEENGFGSQVYICSEGKELRCASSGNQFGGQFGPKQRGHFHRNTHSNHEKKRETILDELIPFPMDIDYKRLLKFKEKHQDLLNTFRNEVEEITLDKSIIVGTPLFNIKLAKLKDSKEQISAKMNESQFGKIFFGSVCGIIAAVQALPVIGAAGALISAAPGFATAIHSALQIEKPEDIDNQNGMKYLALMDKRIGGLNRLRDSLSDKF